MAVWKIWRYGSKRHSTSANIDTLRSLLAENATWAKTLTVSSTAMIATT